MPAAAALLRLLSYYQSSMFEQDFESGMGKSADKAREYRQHIVDNMNQHFVTEGYIATDDDLDLQARFIDGRLDRDKLFEIAKVYGLASVSTPPKE